MKKVLIALCFMLGITGIATAQTNQKKAPEATPIQKKAPAAATTPRPAVVLKKDGTPDKRFKANKLKIPADYRVKKEGALDIRNKKSQVKKG